MSFFDPDNMLLYVQEVSRFARLLAQRGELHVCMREPLTEQTQSIFKRDIERAAGFKVSISRSNHSSAKPKSHPHVYLIKRLDEQVEAEADHEVEARSKLQDLLSTL